jgi:intracellular multiplication protein IcmG
MADNDQHNDEYQFADLDAITPDAGDESEILEGIPLEEPAPKEGDVPIEEKKVFFDRDFFNKGNMKRNALIAIGALILLIILYELLSAIFSSKKPPTTTVPSIASQPAIVQPKPISPPINQVAPVDPQINQKLSVLETAQQSMRADVSTVNNQLGGLNQSINALNTKITELSGIIVSLNAKVDEQAREIEQLTIRRVEAKRPRPIVRKAPHYPKYYLQAVIPGRAWLIATNGATLTVREGTIIAGYGVVKLIDPNQGRVLTSSGQVIRFSQEDS